MSRGILLLGGRRAAGAGTCTRAAAVLGAAAAAAAAGFWGAGGRGNGRGGAAAAAAAAGRRAASADEGSGGVGEAGGRGGGDSRFPNIQTAHHGVDFAIRPAGQEPPQAPAALPRPLATRRHSSAPTPPRTSFQQLRPNPFEFYKHPVTGRLQDPVYSARRQAQLVKMARDHGVEALLPASAKNPTQRLAHRVEHGLRVKGTGVGQKVKGHIHERHMIAKMEQRRKAMLEMPELIKKWKTVGKRNWTKFPK
ncbi:hypothetical protein NLG97_g9995 [Lecanicillium saksenae]|uniref:Uncharacterized protein n=1 Tax=Lecanicillium saksenae TaxID=468837 RepID=A0ACC1QG99_9HYPO|nr:hypothetical protein NLG97_g9995 [Lecanicillium saksenae]